MTFFLDTVTGSVIANRAVLGLALAGVVILVEALVLYELGWTDDQYQPPKIPPRKSGEVTRPRRQLVACLRDSFLANLASTAVGWFLAQYVFFFSFWSIPFWITAFLTTIVVETFILLVLRKNSVGRSGIAALAMNGASYLLLIIVFGLAYQLELSTSL